MAIQIEQVKNHIIKSRPLAYRRYLPRLTRFARVAGRFITSHSTPLVALVSKRSTALIKFALCPLPEHHAVSSRALPGRGFVFNVHPSNEFQTLPIFKITGPGLPPNPLSARPSGKPDYDQRIYDQTFLRRVNLIFSSVVAMEKRKESPFRPLTRGTYRPVARAVTLREACLPPGIFDLPECVKKFASPAHTPFTSCGEGRS